VNGKGLKAFPPSIGRLTKLTSLTNSAICRSGDSTHHGVPRICIPVEAAGWCGCCLVLLRCSQNCWTHFTGMHMVHGLSETFMLCYAVRPSIQCVPACLLQA
jgi:hypothetical protein